jgi:hypothetical protein
MRRGIPYWKRMAGQFLSEIDLMAGSYGWSVINTVLPDGQGGSVIVLADSRNTIWQIYGQRIDAAGKGFLGVDAIYTGVTEYVMGAGGGFGAWYESSTNGNFTNWGRSGGENYPSAIGNDWRNARLHDAAFWYESGSYATPPSQKYIVLLAADIQFPGQTTIPGWIYKWDVDFSQFDRIDAGTAKRGVTRIWRDMSNANVQYVQAQDGIYKLSGSYQDIKIEKLPKGTKVGDLNIDPVYKKHYKATK